MFGDKLKNAGINSNSLLKGALGILGPIMLAKMLGGGRSRGGGMGDCLAEVEALGVSVAFY